MRQCRVGLAAVIICLLPIAAYTQQNPSDAELTAAIAKLGEGTDKNGFARFEILYKNPRRAAELLISSLEPMQRAQYLSGKHPQVVWDIRALRSLTGLDFRATTNSKLDDEEAHFLDRNTKGEVHFFGTWMSRDRVWVAPLDAQTAIIAKWRFNINHEPKVRQNGGFLYFRPVEFLEQSSYPSPEPRLNVESSEAERP